MDFYFWGTLLGIVSSSIIILKTLVELFKRMPKIPGLVTVRVVKKSLGWEIQYELPKDEATRQILAENEQLKKDVKFLNKLTKMSFRDRVRMFFHSILFLLFAVFAVLFIVKMFKNKKDK